MRFFYIRHSLDKKIIGHYPQIKKTIYSCHVWDNPLFIDRFHSEKITVKPIVANTVLHPKSKLTDIVNNSDMGFTLKMLISGKLKAILEVKKTSGMQFFQSSVFKDGIEYEDYWILNPYEFNPEYIDYSKSKIIARIKKKEGGTEPKILDVSSREEFIKINEFHKAKMEIVSIENVCVYPHVDKDLFFINTGGRYVVSEKLKQEIEEACCVGIEFQPIELSFNEWLSDNGEREKKYDKA